jgi:hypothetical protein
VHRVLAPEVRVVAAERVEGRREEVVRRLARLVLERAGWGVVVEVASGAEVSGRAQSAYLTRSTVPSSPAVSTP